MSKMSNLKDDIFRFHIYETREDVAPILLFIKTSLNQREREFQLNTVAKKLNNSLVLVSLIVDEFCDFLLEQFLLYQTIFEDSNKNRI